MRCVATSDLHGSLPKIPECDLLIIAGDVCPIENESRDYQWRWLERTFKPWLSSLSAKHIVGIAGNHDFVFEAKADQVETIGLPWNYLRDSGIEVGGLKIYGLPWVPNLPRWAFHAPDDLLKRFYERVPDDTDIVVSHGPPHKLLDNPVQRFGTQRANEMIKRVKPSLFICGHVHEGYGHVTFEDTEVYNVAYMDITYTPAHAPVMIDLARSSERTRRTQP